MLKGETQIGADEEPHFKRLLRQAADDLPAITPKITNFVRNVFRVILPQQEWKGLQRWYTRPAASLGVNLMTGWISPVRTAFHSFAFSIACLCMPVWIAAHSL